MCLAPLSLSRATRLSRPRRPMLTRNVSQGKQQESRPRFQEINKEKYKETDSIDLSSMVYSKMVIFFLYISLAFSK
jgi:hypothetical protein